MVIEYQRRSEHPDNRIGGCLGRNQIFKRRLKEVSEILGEQTGQMGALLLQRIHFLEKIFCPVRVIADQPAQRINKKQGPALLLRHSGRIKKNKIVSPGQPVAQRLYILICNRFRAVAYIPLNASSHG